MVENDYNHCFETHVRIAKTGGIVAVCDQEKLRQLIKIPFCPSIRENLKGHQLQGVRFIWACLQRKSCRNAASGNGCIIAHAMGLGKTIQIVSFAYLLFRFHDLSKSWPQSHISCLMNSFPLFSRLSSNGGRCMRRARILVVTPATTITNWINEWQKWTDNELCLLIHNFNATCSDEQKLDLVQRWFQDGGLAIVGYEMYRELVRSEVEFSLADGRVLSVKYADYLSESGPDILVCDEAHRLKNRQTQTYQTLAKVQTPFKICMTGYPLQNCLYEYFTMVDFVRPRYLGQDKVFRIKYEHPIVNGMRMESNAEVRIYGLQRRYVLRELIEPFVFRLDTTLSLGRQSFFGTNKIEYVIQCSLNEFQLALYSFLIGNRLNVQRKNIYSSFLKKIHELRQIVNHPAILLLKLSESFNALQQPKAIQKKYGSSEGTSIQPIELDSGSSDDEVNENEINTETDSVMNNNGDDHEEISVATDFSTDDLIMIRGIARQFPNLTSAMWSSKMKITLQILKECIRLKEKVLLFSYYVSSLDYIETALNDPKWIQPLSYLRMDGNTPVAQRQQQIDRFNTDPSIHLFIISTRAGSLGVNCQSASRVVLFDVGFNPCDDEQAVARAFRYGQKRDVHVYRLYGYDTVEDTLTKRCLQKLNLSRLVVDNKESASISFSQKEISDYFKSPQMPFEDAYSKRRRLRQFTESDSVLERLLSPLSGVENHANIVDIVHFNSPLEFNNQIEGAVLDEAKRFLDKERESMKRRGFQ